jgi:glycosyltransferase involved in cell wall biosynthesis
MSTSIVPNTNAEERRSFRLPVSVVLPVRNEAPRLDAAIASITRNFSTRDELVVVVNGSTDESYLVAQRSTRHLERIKVINLENVGLVNALNLGIHLAENEIIVRADADDSYPAERIDDQVDSLTTGSVAVFGDYCLRRGGKQLAYVPSAISSPYVALSLAHPVRTPHPGSLFLRAAWEAAGRYKHEDFPCEDLGLWLRMSHVGNFSSVPKPVVFHQHSRATKTKSTLKARQLTAKKLLSSNPVQRSVFEAGLSELVDYRRTLQGISHSLQRQALATYDLILWSQILDVSLRKCLDSLFLPGTVFGATSIGYERIRGKIRLALSSS